MSWRVCIALVIVSLAVFPLFAVSWQSHEHKFSFAAPHAGWRDMGAVRQGILQEGVVEFVSTNGFVFTVSRFPYRVDEGWELSRVKKTADMTLSMINARVGPIMQIGRSGECRVNGAPGWHYQISYLYAGRVYFAHIVVLVKNDVHYRLLYTWPGDLYRDGHLEYQQIMTSFRISD